MFDRVQFELKRRHNKNVSVGDNPITRYSSKYALTDIVVCGECGTKLPPIENYCPTCDRKFRKGEKFCTECGRKLVNQEKYKENRRIQTQIDENEKKKYLEEKRKKIEELKKT